MSQVTDGGQVESNLPTAAAAATTTATTNPSESVIPNSAPQPRGKSQRRESDNDPDDDVDGGGSAASPKRHCGARESSETDRKEKSGKSLGKCPGAGVRDGCPLVGRGRACEACTLGFLVAYSRLRIVARDVAANVQAPHYAMHLATPDRVAILFATVEHAVATSRHWPMGDYESPFGAIPPPPSSSPSSSSGTADPIPTERFEALVFCRSCKRIQIRFRGAGLKTYAGCCGWRTETINLDAARKRGLERPVATRTKGIGRGARLPKQQSAAPTASSRLALPLEILSTTFSPWVMTPLCADLDEAAAPGFRVTIGTPDVNFSMLNLDAARGLQVTVGCVDLRLYVVVSASSVLVTFPRRFFERFGPNSSCASTKGAARSQIAVTVKTRDGSDCFSSHLTIRHQPLERL